MSARIASGERMTVAQHLDWAEGQPEVRDELVDGAPHRLSPEADRHLIAKGAVYRAFHDAIRAATLNRHVPPDGGTVVIRDRKAREPDLPVVRGTSTIRTDTGDKPIEYFSVDGVQHHLLVHPAERMVVHHRRVERCGIETSIASENSIRFDPPGFSAEIARFFEDLPPGKAH